MREKYAGLRLFALRDNVALFFGRRSNEEKERWS